jgi:hypothetical protein
MPPTRVLTSNQERRTLQQRTNRNNRHTIIHNKHNRTITNKPVTDNQPLMANIRDAIKFDSFNKKAQVINLKAFFTVKKHFEAPEEGKTRVLYKVPPYI